MTPVDLQQLVERVSLASFGRPFVHQAIFNTRLKTTGGRYHLNDHHLDFNPKMLMHGEEEFIKIIKHELCHYHLHLQGRGYRHQDHEFKALLAKTGGSRFAPSVLEEVKILTYQCIKCQQTFQRRRRLAKKYVCGRCQGSLCLINTNVISVTK